MAVTALQDLVLADEDREWDGDAVEKRARYYKKMDRTRPHPGRTEL
jgi:hypothetical protein